MRDRENWISRRHLIGAAVGLGAGALLNEVAGAVPRPELPVRRSRRWPAETSLAWSETFRVPVAALHPAGSRLYLVDELGTVYSRAAANGAAGWSLKTGQGRVYGNAMGFADGRAYIGGDRLCSVDLSTGRRLAELDEASPEVIARPGALYTSAQVKVDQSRNTLEFRRVDPELTTTLWRRRLGGNISTLMLAGERVMADTGSELHMLDPGTGKTLWNWQEHTTAFGTGRIAAAGADLVVSAGYEYITAIDAVTGADRWTLEGLVLECAAVVGGTIILCLTNLPGWDWPDGLGVAGFDARSGEKRWQIDDVDCPFHVADGLLFTTFDSRVCALDPSTGDMVWRSDKIGSVDRQASGGGMVYAADSSGELFAWHGPH